MKKRKKKKGMKGKIKERKKKYRSNKINKYKHDQQVSSCVNVCVRGEDKVSRLTPYVVLCALNMCNSDNVNQRCGGD